MSTYPISNLSQISNLNEIYEKYFGIPAKRDGVFVEVGASDGYAQSNTWGLAELGWRGIYIEPHPERFDKCKKKHELNNVTVLQMAIGDKKGRTKLYLGENPTINEETVNLNPFGFKYNRNNYIEVEIDTLNNVLDMYLRDSYFLDLVVIDVEGAELEVLRGFDILSFMPTMIIIETAEGDPDIQRTYHTNQILSYMENFPYKKIQSDGINSIYIQEGYA